MRPTRPKRSAGHAQDGAVESKPRRQQLVDAAIRCFEEKGFHGASMAQISEAAGMSVGHIYHYFPAKEALIAAIVETKLGEFFARMTEAARDSSLLEALTAHQEGPENEARRRERALYLEILAESERNPQIAELMEKANESMLERQREIVRALEPAAADLPEADLNRRLEMFNALQKAVHMLPRTTNACSTYERIVEPLMRKLLQFGPEPTQAKS